MIDIYSELKKNKSDVEIIFDEYVPLTIRFNQSCNFKKYIRLANDNDFIELGIDRQSNQLIELTIVSLKTTETVTKSLPVMLSSSGYGFPFIKYPDEDKDYVIYDVPFSVGIYQNGIVITFNRKISCYAEELRVTENLSFSYNHYNESVQLILTSLSDDDFEKFCLAIV